MLPVVIGARRTAVVVMGNTLLLVGISILPFFYGLGWLYLACAIGGGGYFIYCNYLMIDDPSPGIAMKSFFASLVQLIVLMTGAVLDASLFSIYPS
jgi:protoheme IX farnesyltransferase